MTFSKEPTIWLGVLRAGLYLATTLGLSLGAAQTAAVVLFFEALTVAINRQVVTPVAKPKDPPSGSPPADDPAPPTPRTGSVPPNEAAMVGLFAAVLFVACGGAQKPQPSGCGELDYAALSATCGDDEDLCNAKIEERQRECDEKIRSGQ